MLIAQITDLHARPRGLPAYRVSETNSLIERAVDALLALRPRPDVVLVTGDLTDCGLPEEYEALRPVLARLPMPVYLVPGNHDRREALREAFADWPGVTAHPRFVQCVVEDFAVRLIGLDTLVPGQSHGALCPERLGFLEDALGRDRTRPAVVFLHHPPFACGLRHMDRIRLLDGAEELAAILRRNPQVERVLCGHHHRTITTRFGGTLAMIVPGVAHQVQLDLAETDESEGALVFEPPAYALHRYTPEEGMASHVAYVERFPGPFPFVLDAAYPGAH